MSAGSAVGLCRLRFHTPERVFELAVPSDVALADLMPAVLGFAGPDLDETGVEHGGWVLQRLGGEPLDEERTADALDLRDGEQLYLRPRYEALPPVHFDDLVDGVRTGMVEQGDSWRPVMTHHLAVGVAVTALGGGLFALALPGAAPLRALVAAALAVLLLLGGAAASRAVGDPAAGTALGITAVPYLVLAAVLLPTGGRDLLTARLLTGGSAAAAGAVLALGAVGCSAPLFLGTVWLAVLTAGAAGFAMGGLSLTASAALVATLAVLGGALIPSVSFRLSGLRLPALPRNAEELQEDIDPFPAQEVIDRSRVADGFLTGFYAATGLACAACLTVLVGGSGWGTAATAADLCLLLLLHARAIGSLRQRLAVLLPGLYGAVLLAGRFGLHADPAGRLVLSGVLLGAAALLSVVAWTVPGRRLLPYWGRAADLLHSLTAMALLPLALQAAGFYQVLRGAAG